MRSDTRTTRWTRVIRTALVFVLSLTVYVQANPDDYYVYGYWNLGASGNDYLTGIGGYVDTAGITGWGAPGDEYVVFAGGPSYSGAHYAYVYRVETAGDRNQHPSNVGPDGIAGTADDAIGPIAPRTFTQIGNPFYLGSYRAGHENDFQIDRSR